MLSKQAQDTIEKALYYARANVENYWHHWAGDKDEADTLEKIDAALAEVRAAAQPRYSHRNGETEPPTVGGWYWFRGLFDGVPVGGLVKVNLPDRAFPTLTMSPQWIDGWVEAEVFDGQWYGPIVPPWQVQP